MTAGFRHDDLRRRNRAMLIAAVRRAGSVSRTDLVAATGLSHSTISAISADLISEGVLAETRAGDLPTARRGRPQVGLGLDPQAATVVTVALTLNHLTAALVDYAGEVKQEDHRRLPTKSMPTAELVEAMVAMVGRLVELRPAEAGPVARIVVAVQGTTDAAARRLLWSPIASQADIPFASILEDAFGVPTTVENDCSMIAIALRWKQPERYREDFIAILLSHGIGMGLVLKGELFGGTQSSGCEFGHMVHRPDGALCRCGRRGCVEAYAGSYAIWRSAGLLPDDAEPAADIGDDEMAALAARARAADGPERAAFRRAGEALGFGLGSLFALVDPAPVALVGRGALAFDLIQPALAAAIARTAGGEHSGALSFAVEPDEMPLIRDGAAMRALTYVDEEVLAPGAASGLPS